MTTESTTQATAATTTEGQAASVIATDATATAAAPGSTTQQAAAATSDGTATASTTGAAATTEGDKSAPQGAPDKYEFKAPEGKDFDPAVLAQFSEVAKELNLSQDNAQKVIDKIAPALAEKQARMLTETRNAWVESAKADKEFGGDALEENLSVAKKALDTFGSDELKTLLKESGLGDHPEIVRVFYRAGKAISEDGKLVAGGKAITSNDAKSFYPNSNMS